MKKTKKNLSPLKDVNLQIEKTYHHVPKATNEKKTKLNNNKE